ncbi:MAG TPA: hypothetical protein VHC04_07680 [Rhodopila sp.]|nr:hypothetical protein [Rhodopila sp.]
MIPAGHGFLGLMILAAQRSSSPMVFVARGLRRPMVFVAMILATP